MYVMYIYNIHIVYISTYTDRVYISPHDSSVVRSSTAKWLLNSSKHMNHGQMQRQQWQQHGGVEQPHGEK